MDIHQLSVKYVREHDRLLLRVNTTAQEEFRLWFTQRLLKGLLPPLQRAAADLEARQTPLADTSDASKRMLAEFRQEETVRQSDFKTPYKADVAHWPLGEAPLLVTDVSLKLRGRGHLEIVFDEKLPDAPPRGFTMALQPQLVHALMHLMAGALKASEWPLGLDTLASPSTSSALEADADEPRPRYLS